MKAADLLIRWRTLAENAATYGADCVALRRCADELESALRDADDDSVTLLEAHEIGGYSVDHLQRVVREGRLKNVGTKGRIRIRRSDVPRKPGHALPTPTARGQFDRSAVVASVISRRVS